jgi:hypothetical protein
VNSTRATDAIHVRTRTASFGWYLNLTHPGPKPNQNAGPPTTTATRMGTTSVGLSQSQAAPAQSAAHFSARIRLPGSDSRVERVGGGSMVTAV